MFRFGHRYPARIFDLYPLMQWLELLYWLLGGALGIQLVLWLNLYLHWTWDNGHGTWDMGQWTWDNGHGTWDNGHGTWDNGHGTWDNGHGTWDNGQWTLDIEKYPMSKDDRAIPISIVICARNESDRLQEYLSEVLQQDYPDFEVIVVDDNSTDNTADVLRRLLEEFPERLRLFNVEQKTQPGKKQALSLGIHAARHECLVFTDADCRPASRNWLHHMAVPLAEKQTEIVLGYGPLLPAPGLLNRWARFETTMVALQYFSLARAGRPYMGVGRNLAWRRPLFERAGGFEAHRDLASGDDDLLINAVARPDNTACCLHPEAWTWSAAPDSWRGWLRQKRRHLSAGWRYRLTDQIILAATGLSHAGFYALCLTLLLSGHWSIPLGAYALRAAIVWPVFSRVARRLGVSDLWRCWPVLDMGWAVYQGGVTPGLLVWSNRSGKNWK